MVKTILLLKNGYKFRGEIIEETPTHLIINDIKDGRTSCMNQLAVLAPANL